MFYFTTHWNPELSHKQQRLTVLHSLHELEKQTCKNQQQLNLHVHHIVTAMMIKGELGYLGIMMLLIRFLVCDNGKNSWKIPLRLRQRFFDHRNIKRSKNS